jgi:hypothetical protein
MRCVLLSLFLLGSLAGVAQPRWTFGLQGAFLYSIAQRADHADMNDFYSQDYLPTAAGGLIVQYRVSSRVQLESGLHLTGVGFRHVFRYTVPSGMRLSQKATTKALPISGCRSTSNTGWERFRCPSLNWCNLTP